MEETDRYISIMDTSFLNTTREEFIQDILVNRIKNHEKTFVVTANPEIVMYKRKHKHYSQLVDTATYIIPDGIGIVKASRLLKKPLKERVAGFDVMIDLLKEAEWNGWRCFFLGASEEVSKKMVKRLKHTYPDLKIAGSHHGYFNINDPKIADYVKHTNPDIVFVALGFPKQETWIANHLNDFNKGLFIGVGGSFDVLAGKVKRAPNFWIKLHLEWFYRLLQQPSRIKRVWKVFQFLFLIFVQRKRGK